MRPLLAAFCLLSCFCETGAARAGSIRTVRLTCGGTHFIAVTHSIHFYDTAQEISARPSGAARSSKVELRQSTFVLHRGIPGLAVLADVVSTWGCATTPKGSFLMLQYSCPQLLPEDVPARFCSESGEWYRYVALDGSLLDKGFGLGRGLGDSNPRERGLRRRLGLPADDENVAFEDVS